MFKVKIKKMKKITIVAICFAVILLLECFVELFWPKIATPPIESDVATLITIFEASRKELNGLNLLDVLHDRGMNAFNVVAELRHLFLFRKHEQEL